MRSYPGYGRATAPGRREGDGPSFVSGLFSSDLLECRDQAASNIQSLAQENPGLENASEKPIRGWRETPPWRTCIRKHPDASVRLKERCPSSLSDLAPSGGSNIIIKSFFAGSNRPPMSNFRKIDRETGFFLPPRVNEWLPERYLARFVARSDRGAVPLGDDRQLPGHRVGDVSPEAIAGRHGLWLCHRCVLQPQAGAGDIRLVAFRFIAANEHPDHDTIADVPATVSREKIEALFVQVLLLAREMGML